MSIPHARYLCIVTLVFLTLLGLYRFRRLQSGSRTGDASNKHQVRLMMMNSCPRRRRALSANSSFALGFSSSGRPYTTPKGHSPAWTSKVCVPRYAFISFRRACLTRLRLFHCPSPRSRSPTRAFLSFLISYLVSCSTLIHHPSSFTLLYFPIPRLLGKLANRRRPQTRYIRSFVT